MVRFVKKILAKPYIWLKYKIKEINGFWDDIVLLKRNYKNRKSDFVLIVYYGFHKSNKWQVAGQYYFHESLINDLNPIIVSSKLGAWLFVNNEKKIFSSEPGYAAPKVRLSSGSKNIVFVSDPHSKPSWLPEYYERNNINYIFTPYRDMFLNTDGLSSIPEEKVISFPWSIPDHLINENNHIYNDEIVIFGAVKNTNIYGLRARLGGHELVSSSYNYGGSENKALVLEDYFRWLSKFSCCIAAVSEEDYFSIPVAKYFEIPASGCLLFAHESSALEELGFVDGENCIIFNQDNFDAKANDYKQNFNDYAKIRKAGVELIKSQHCVSHRVDAVKNFNFK
ncbi:glycosyltransferase family 1 protein [Vibrio parahaemolyticus]|nr:glycosyltransferase family 1 protein [Vibrio parahaemolyticus]